MVLVAIANAASSVVVVDDVVDKEAAAVVVDATAVVNKIYLYLLKHNNKDAYLNVPSLTKLVLSIYC